MKVQCCREGWTMPEAIYALPPLEAARSFCEASDADPRYGPVNVEVEPLDDEAKALPGWHADKDSPAFRMFVVTPRTTWAAREVDTFNRVSRR